MALDFGAYGHDVIKFGRILCEQSGVDHPFKVVAQGDERRAFGNQRQAATYGVVIVDWGASNVFLGIEPGFM